MNDRSPWEALDAGIVGRLRRSIPDLTTAVAADVRAGLDGALDEATEANLVTGISAAVEDFFGRQDAHGIRRDIHRAQGRAQHDAGRSIEEMLRFYQLGGLATWRNLTDPASGLGLTLDVLPGLGEALFGFIADISAAAADGYAEARSAAVRHGQATRDRLLAHLLADPAESLESIERAAARADWPVPTRLCVAVTDGAAGARLLDRLSSRILVGQHREQTCIVAPESHAHLLPGRLATLLEGEPAGMGPVVALPDALSSARHAETLWRLCRRGALGDLSVARAEEHPVELILAADREVAAAFADATLAPLNDLRDRQRQPLTETLVAWLGQPDRPQAISTVLHIHVQTVRYRIRQLRELFGATFDDPQGRFDLALALRIRALEHGSDHAVVPVITGTAGRPSPR